MTEQSKTLREWSAKRSGTSITIHGTDISNGEATKLVHIAEITPPASAADHHVLAIDGDGVEHKLTFA